MASTHLLEITTPLGQDAFIVQRFSGREELGRLSEYQVSLISKRKNITAQDILGKDVTVSLEGKDNKPRYFNGYVTRFSLFGEVNTPAFKDNRGYAYAMTIRPWLWFLTRTSTCQIFQQKDIPAIIKEVMDRKPYSKLSSYELRLSGTYQIWENCVQYRETDFNFISRLMEQEGIYYYFEQDNGKHVMVLADGMGVHTPHPGLKEIEFDASRTDKVREKHYITGWDTTVEIQPGSYAMDDFDFEKPRAELAKAKDISRSHDLAGFEIFDYPGEYVIPEEGEHYAKVRIEELQCQHELSQATTDARQIEAGRTLKLKSHPVEAQNREYLITACNFQATELAPTSGGAAEADFNCNFSAMPKGAAEFRPQRLTPKPIVQGPQTAIVVGPSGDEIHTDQYGRVKVQFHWDRYGKSDQDSSCWVRVSQLWAGKGWGGMALPRIGQEVIVGFLEGDPDWPIITGRVYNADQPPPYKLPDQQTITTIVSRSTPNGTKDNYNELRFDDRKGDEHIFMQAEKDYYGLIKNDSLEWVKNEYHLKIDQGRFEETGGDRQDKCKGDLNAEVTGEYSLKVGQNHQHKVGQGYNIDAGTAVHIKAGTTLVIEAGTSISIKAGGSFVNIGPAGVDISGTMVKINSGGSPGSGAGTSTKSPEAVREVKDLFSSDKNEGLEKTPPNAPTKYSAPAAAFKDAAESGAPFV
ncbi:MAG: type VI secretion system tip protein VgrG [Gallionellaceae bacterium]|nr:type VI secretion system tip protein VgrG [Gallionellaceae bacterium]